MSLYCGRSTVRKGRTNTLEASRAVPKDSVRRLADGATSQENDRAFSRPIAAMLIDSMATFVTVSTFDTAVAGQSRLSSGKRKVLRATMQSPYATLLAC